MPINTRREREYGDIRLADECSEICLVLIEPRCALSDHRLPWRFQGDRNSVSNAIVETAPGSDTCRLIWAEKWEFETVKRGLCSRLGFWAQMSLLYKYWKHTHITVTGRLQWPLFAMFHLGVCRFYNPVGSWNPLKFQKTLFKTSTFQEITKNFIVFCSVPENLTFWRSKVYSRG